MPLPSEQVIEVPLTAPNQRGVTTTVPAGELNYIKNGVCEKFDADGKLRVQKREAFKNLTVDVRHVNTGAQISSVGFEVEPNLLSSLENQVVVAAGTAPHVLAEEAESWSKYPYVYSPLSLKERTIRGGNIQIANPDCAEMNGVRLYSWSEPLYDTTTPLGKVYITMQAADGTRIMYREVAGNGNVNNRAKVVADGTRFWVIWNSGVNVSATAYDTNGEVLGELAGFIALDDSEYGYDVTVVNGIVLYVQWNNETAKVSKITWGVGTPTQTTTDMSFLSLASVAVAWAEDATASGKATLMTIHRDPDFGGVVYAYEIGTLSATPTVTAYFGVLGRVYDEDGEGGTTGRHIELTGVLMSDGLHMQVSMLHATDRRQDRTVFIRTTTAAAIAVDPTKRTVRAVSRPFPLESGKWAILVYYPSTLTTVIAANGANPPRAFGGNPTYFILEIISRQIVGRINDGQAGMEWAIFGYHVISGTLSRGPFAFCVPHTFVDSDGITHIPVGVNGDNISRVETVTFPGQDILRSLDITKNASTTRFCELRIGNLGQAQEYAGRLFMPGPIATEFDGQDFAEQGINIPLEQPTAVASAVGGTKKTLLGQYQHVVVLEGTNNNGERIRSAPSIPVQTNLTGSQDTITLTGLIQHMTNHANLTVAVYVNVMDAGAPTTIRYKVSNDLVPVVNRDGDLTWTFVDNFTDNQALVGEKLYTDQGLLPRDPLPAFDVACIGENRTFVVGPGNVIHFTCEASDAYPLWYNDDSHKFSMPTDDPVRALCWMDQRLFMLCENGIWWVPGGRWPGPDGLGGNMQAPVRLPFNNGCTGFAKLIDKGIAYGSSAGGVWLVTRSLENERISDGLQDEFDESRPAPVAGIDVDTDQRVVIALRRVFNQMKAYDQRCKTWSSWQNYTNILHTHVIRGKHAYADSNSVKVQTVGEYLDDTTMPDASENWYEFAAEATFSLMNIKGLKRVWKFLLAGEQRALFKMSVLATYVTEDLDATETFEFEPEQAERFDNDFMPRVEEMSQMVIRVSDGLPDDEEGMTGDSFAWDLASFTVGTEGGLVRTPPSTRRRSSI